ncbi:asparagine synthase (glutamine-hydrolyzing) [Longispora albida]|uniref:asparagine synthase (glutamine-hydrolyzing) n=1 Tax=Longispora albida TaxID=203523 RepID=UPI000367F7E9|nr:asparagine synthase (glutamine-hydrolyzing) [Longispora albida]
MCGIAGWVSFNRDLTAELGTLEAMTATMALRGPDASGLLVERHAALGHRRLAVIDIAGGTQPMTVEENGRLLSALTFSGEIYNFRALKTELEGHGHRFRTRSDTEVVLRAYLQWGQDVAAHLDGMFAFAIWDARTEELFLIRDRMGVKPLFYSRTGDGVIFGSEPKALFAHPAVRPIVDMDGLREMLAHAKTPGLTVYRDVAEVEPGHVVRVDTNGLTIRRYWALEAREHDDDLPTTIATVRSLLEDIIRKYLVSDVPLCALLSGGLDSSVLVALAAEAERSAGRKPPRTFSVDFAGQAFRTETLRATPDRPYAMLMAQHAGAKHRIVELDSTSLLDQEVTRAVLAARDLPVGFGNMDTSLLLLFRAVREHATVALSGEAADELFGGYRWFHDPVATASGTFPWVSSMSAIAGAGSIPLEGLLSRELREGLDLPGYRAERYAQALAEVPHGERTPDPVERRMREICYLNLTRFQRILLDRKDRISMAAALEVRVPFCDHHLVQYVFNTPWAMKSFDGREKSLLRAATQHLLPSEVAERVKAPYPRTQDPGYARALQTGLSSLAADIHAPARDYLDTAAVAQALAPDADPEAASTATEIALDLDTWLRDYSIDLRL